MNTITNISNYLNTHLNNYFTKLVSNPKSIANLEDSFPRLIKQMSVETLSATLELIDDKYAASSERKRNYIIKDKRSRTVVTAFGTMTYRRRYYCNKETNSYYFYLDDLLELLPYKRCTPRVEALILENLAKDTTATYKKAAKPFGMSKGFVYTLLKQLDIQIDTPDLKRKIKCNQLYIQADEEHIHLQYKKGGRRKGNGKMKTTNYELHEVTIFTGKERIGSKRYRLLNKVIMTPYYEESSDDFNKRINDYIQRNYSFQNMSYCYGDGALWIKKLAEDTASHYILDKFHFSQALIRATGGDSYPVVYAVLKRYAREGNKEEFEFLINMHMGLESRTSEVQMKSRNYIFRNWNAYQKNYQLEKQSGCSAEGINSHYFASYFSSRPKGFTKENIHTIGMIRALYYSGFNIPEFYQENRKEINKEVHEYYISEKYKGKVKNILFKDSNFVLPAINQISSTGKYLQKFLIQTKDSYMKIH